MTIYIVLTLDGHYMETFLTESDAKAFVAKSDYVCGVFKEIAK